MSSAQADAYAGTAPPPPSTPPIPPLPQTATAPRIDVADLRPLTALPVTSLPGDDPATEPPRTEPVAPSTPPPVRPLSPDPTPEPGGTGPRSADTAAAEAGFWVQLGAFGRRDGAVALQRQTAPQLQALAPSFAVVVERGLHRLQAGPYGSRSAAQTAAQRMGAVLRLRPVVVERR
ncbi:SPOR domain-containing protein [Xylophilus ampelinus]|nr:SPOR domain-containing protein [Xylophilus ampelinus]